MSEPFVGEIRMFAGNFAPRGWAFCDGQLLSVAQNDALFSLLGTIYGGDGRTTFGLPDCRGRIAIHHSGHHRLGSKGGAENVTLTVNQLPSHSHTLNGSNDVANESSPENRAVAQSSLFDLYQTANPTVDMSSNTTTSMGGSQAHNNMMPYLCIHFIIALVGIYPSRH
ncbi:MAG: tail fiber protein [Proteobacteria bacterium]|nr:tail fiber protein [Pseudomonadota bacterium]